MENLQNTSRRMQENFSSGGGLCEHRERAGESETPQLNQRPPTSTYARTNALRCPLFYHLRSGLGTVKYFYSMNVSLLWRFDSWIKYDQLYCFLQILKICFHQISLSILLKCPCLLICIQKCHANISVVLIIS